MLDDRQLLRQFTVEGSEAAFGELVRRYLGLVYSAALRRTGDPHLAEDVAQVVFTDLARKALALPPGIVLAGWLHRATRFAASNLRRSEQRRQAREQEAAAAMSPSEPPSTDWEQVRPLLDEAVDRLDRRSRDALLLRFFERRTLAEVGSALGLSEDAARKRVSRALETLRTDLVSRGATTTAAILAAVLPANAVQLAPAGLAAAIAGASLAGAAGGTGTTLTLIRFMAMTKLKAGAIAVVIVASVATPMLIQHHETLRLRQENESLRQQVEQIPPLVADNERLSNQLAQVKAAPRLAEAQVYELLRLRGEVAQLRAGQGTARGASQPSDAQAQPLPATQSAPAGLDQLLTLARAAYEEFNTNKAGLSEDQTAELSRKAFASLNAAVDTLTEQAAQGNQAAVQTILQAVAVPELQGSAIHALGVLAGQGNESALDLLTHPDVNHLVLSSVVAALKPAADNGNQPAIDLLAAVAGDPKQKPLGYLAADGLNKAAENGNTVAIDALIALSDSSNVTIRAAAIAGLTRSAAYQNPKAVEALQRAQAR